MRKVILLLILGIMPLNICYAEEFVLSDILREAREAKMKQSAEEKIEQSLNPVKNQNYNENTLEQSACEKINPKELLQSENQD